MFANRTQLAASLLQDCELEEPGSAPSRGCGALARWFHAASISLWIPVLAAACRGGCWRLIGCWALLPSFARRNRLAALAPQRVVPLEPGDEIAGPEVLSRLRAASPIVAQAAPEHRDACGRVALLQRLGQVALPHITLVRRSKYSLYIPYVNLYIFPKVGPKGPPI